MTRSVTAFVLVLILVAGCSGGGGGGGSSDPDAVADFHLPDVNPQSATSGQDVSPRDYLGGVSAWYFAHST